jgi:Ca2+-binding EF-hand superfamily protein
MKKIPLLAAGVAALGLITSAGLFAASAGSGPKARIFAEFDTNKNGVIDGEEIAAVRKAFAAAPRGQFATYDKNNDGKLDAAEIAAIKPPGAKKDGEKKSGGKKSADSEKKSETK